MDLDPVDMIRVACDALEEEGRDIVSSRIRKELRKSLLREHEQDRRAAMNSTYFGHPIPELDSQGLRAAAGAARRSRDSPAQVLSWAEVADWLEERAEIMDRFSADTRSTPTSSAAFPTP